MTLEFTLPTALILIDNQSGFSNPKTISHWGTTRSNPSYETNLQALLSAFRSARSSSSTPLEVIHIFHSSTTPGSLLHPSNQEQGIRPLDFATPTSDGSEPVFWKSVNSSFIGTGLEAHLREKGFCQLVIAGLTTVSRLIILMVLPDLQQHPGQCVRANMNIHTKSNTLTTAIKSYMQS